MPTLHDIETMVGAEIRAFTPLCFQNLLSRNCDRVVEGSGAEDGVGMRIEPEFGACEAKPVAEGVQFAMLGRLHAGRFRKFDVRVHGVVTEDGVGFTAIELAYGHQGPGSPVEGSVGPITDRGQWPALEEA